MRKRIIYGILKTYKGIFIKKHIGNVQLLIIEMEKSFWILNIIGELKNGNYISQLLLRTKPQYINEFLDDFESNENFIQIEEIFCEIPKENENHYKLLLKKKGKYINSNLDIKFSTEFSQGNIKMYEIDGKFKLTENDFINNKSQIKMKALKKKVIAQPLMTRFMASLKR